MVADATRPEPTLLHRARASACCWRVLALPGAMSCRPNPKSGTTLVPRTISITAVITGQRGAPRRDANLLRLQRAPGLRKGASTLQHFIQYLLENNKQRRPESNSKRAERARQSKSKRETTRRSHSVCQGSTLWSPRLLAFHPWRLHRDHTVKICRHLTTKILTTFSSEENYDKPLSVDDRFVICDDRFVT